MTDDELRTNTDTRPRRARAHLTTRWSNTRVAPPLQMSMARAPVAEMASVKAWRLPPPVTWTATGTCQLPPPLPLPPLLPQLLLPPPSVVMAPVMRMKALVAALQIVLASVAP